MNQNRRERLAYFALAFIGTVVVVTAYGAFSSLGVGRSAPDICAGELPGSVIADLSRVVAPIVVVVCVVADFDSPHGVYAVDLWSNVVLVAGFVVFVAAVVMILRIRKRDKALLHEFPDQLL